MPITANYRSVYWKITVNSMLYAKKHKAVVFPLRDEYGAKTN
ncbi:hypothetical protein P343_15010 [Sporolactobacillus laevolacticus DSM 442]|uniref:Uncharacterized protein n=1 Tax=Sporolactobacillus laevolacticus DSM 442 TaxID=1395513 RepID=V6IV01_9BACL|nr:hypothetical protein P343_15010 [Sporolactobacillus laevolacticus DSM 442]